MVDAFSSLNLIRKGCSSVMLSSPATHKEKAARQRPRSKSEDADLRNRLKGLTAAGK